MEWSLIVNAPKELEDIYTSFLVANLMSGKVSTPFPKEREEMIRRRFRNYMQNMNLYVAPEDKLRLDSKVEEGKIVIVNY